MFKSTDDYPTLCGLFNYRFTNPNLLAKAITRKTAWLANRQEKDIGYQETLTYLGGDILRAVIDDILFSINPNYAKGSLSPERDKLIGKHTIARVAENLGLERYILMSGGDEGSFKGAGRAKILSDTLKAILAAIFLDSGENYFLLRRFIRKNWTLPNVYLESLDGTTAQSLCQHEHILTSLGYTFDDKQLIARALTRKSALQEGIQAKELGHNETLATLGDGVLRMVMGNILLMKNPQLDLEAINDQMDRLVSNQSIAIIADQMNLDDHLIMGKGERYNFEHAGRNKILATTVEAIIGAVFLDSNRDYNLIKRFIGKHWQLIKPSPQSISGPNLSANTVCTPSYRTAEAASKATPYIVPTNSKATTKSSIPTDINTSRASYLSEKSTYANYRSDHYESNSYTKSSSKEGQGSDLGTLLAIGGLLVAGTAAAYHLSQAEKTTSDEKKLTNKQVQRSHNKEQDEEEEIGSSCSLL